MQVDRLRVLFLLRGNRLSHVSLGGLAGIELEKQNVPVVEDPARHRRLLQEWWTKFSVVPDKLAREQKMLKRSLLGILARRLSLPGPWPIAPAVDSGETNGLENQFERAIGMLFGIESVELAVQEDVTLNQSRRREEADQPVPERPRMRSLTVPPVPPSTRVEPIAMHVPAECFYLRTGSLANYRYFRRFLLGWGGSLDDIVATRSLDHQTRPKIESQLGLKAEHLDAVTIDQLIEKQLLPRGFARRPDKSVPIIEHGKFRDSLRGSPEAFLPVPDVPLEGATRSEVRSYQQFVRRYNQEWRRVDPVTVVFSRNESATQDHDWVSLDIVITPYAQNHYSLLRRHLASPNSRRVAPVDGDLLSVDTSIRTSSRGRSHLLYLGLRDGNIPFTLENGSLRLVDRPQQSSYAKSHSYAAISPPSTDVLRLVASVFDRQPREQSPIAPPARQANIVPPPAILAPPTVAQVFFYAGWAMGKLSLNYGDFFQYVASVETHDDWTVVSSNSDIRKSTFGKLTKEYAEASPQVRLRMGSLRGAEVEPSIQAYTYLAARRVSSENARFLNDFARWMHLPAKDAKVAVENVLGARICCPLGGDFQLKTGSGHSRWIGTDWLEASLHTVSETPEFWRFPFLDWIRRLDLRFNLGPTTLRAQVDLLVHQDKDPAVDGKTRGLRILNPPTAAVAAEQDGDVIAAKPPITSRSPIRPGAATTTARSSAPPSGGRRIVAAFARSKRAPRLDSSANLGSRSSLGIWSADANHRCLRGQPSLSCRVANRGHDTDSRSTAASFACAVGEVTAYRVEKRWRRGGASSSPWCDPQVSNSSLILLLSGFQVTFGA